MNKYLPMSLVGWLLLGAVASDAWGVVQYTATDLGPLDGLGSNAYGINNSGQVVGEAGLRAFRTAANQPINLATDDLGTLGGDSSAFGINDGGQVVGYASTSGVYPWHAFRTAANQPINPATDDLGTLGGTNSQAWGINNSGHVVGWANTSGGYDHAFRTAANQPINPVTDDLGTLGGAISGALAINDNGQVVGGATTSGGVEHAFRTAANQPINPATDDVSTLGGASSWARGINDSGQVVGVAQTANGSWHAFRTAANQPINPATDDLGTLGGAYVGSGAYGINNSGQVVGESHTVDAVERAFLYSGNGPMQDLNDLIDPASGWTLSEATAINDSGQIAGSGWNINGGWQAFLLTPLATWTGSGGPGSARWDVAANWDTNSVPANVSVTFGITFTNGNTIDLSGDRTAVVLAFTNTDSNDLTLVNGTLTATELRKQVGNGSVTFGDTVSLNVAGGTTVDQGTLIIAGTMLTGSIHGTGSIRIEGTGRVTIRATTVPNTATSTSRVGSLTIAGGTTPTGTLDLNNNSMILDYTGPLGMVLSDVTAQIRSGRNGKDGNDQANWNGPGIITTKGRQENLTATYDLYNLGAINNADLELSGIGTVMTTFGGQAVTPSTVLVKYTYSGDADLSGAVDGDDYTYWLNGFLGLSDPSVQGWLRGDFDYNGVVDGDDYTQWLNAFLFAGAPLGGDGPSPVPEPSALALLVGGCIAAGVCVWRKH